MNFSYTRDVGDGVKTIFTMSFAGQDEGYLSPTNIQVFVNGTTVPFTINATDPNKVYLSTAPSVGSDVLIRRIMPKNVPYSDFKNGNPFSQDTLNNTNLQQLYVTQEILDGFLPDGFYFKQDVNMGGFNIKNLGDAIDPDDAVKKDVTDGLQNRVESLENSFEEVASGTVPWRFVAAGGEQQLSPPYTFTSAMLFINGVTQTLGSSYAYSVSNNKLYLAEPLLAGDEVFILIGASPASPSDYISQDGALLTYAHLVTGVPLSQVYIPTIGSVVANALVFVDTDGIHTLTSPVSGTIVSVNWPAIEIV
jgi:hypothetical protein|uniref:Tail fiber protein n=1 Tax=Caudovirales sp. ctTqA28 TaxID=2826775 RepID=A0A8S5MD34_9CAUD|nr:MAG TPA: tail fiber protein [Caudovirales sp. ctTqA28]